MDSNDMTLLIAATTFLVDLLIVVVAGVWVVSKIQSSTEKLAATIAHLAANVDRQQAWLDSLESTVQTHGERLAVVETKTAT